MQIQPYAKINLGLNVTAKRSDGYHNIETVFYPVKGLYDTLEITRKEIGRNEKCRLQQVGAPLDCNPQQNLVVKAYRLLDTLFELPPVEVCLRKTIPSQAGLGGGSSDAAAMINGLCELFELPLDTEERKRHAAALGADCAFFIDGQPTFATGIGNVFEPVTLHQSLQQCYIAIVKPPVAISTKEAYAMIKPHRPDVSCNNIVSHPIETWRDSLTNDFEASCFCKFPQLKDIKEQLYKAGACYAQMSGSGSAFFGLFTTAPNDLNVRFPDCYHFVGKL